MHIDLYLVFWFTIKINTYFQYTGNQQSRGGEYNSSYRNRRNEGSYGGQPYTNGGDHWGGEGGSYRPASRYIILFIVR